MDLEPCRRVGSRYVCWGFGGVVSVLLMLVAPPTGAIGHAGWSVALLVTAISFLGAFVLPRRGSAGGVPRPAPLLLCGDSPNRDRRMAGGWPRHPIPPALPGGRDPAPRRPSAPPCRGAAGGQPGCPRRPAGLRE